MKHTLPKLDYEFDSLEPFIDSKTMEIHYTKHHQAYIDKLNLALEKYPDLQKLKIEELIKNLTKIPEEIRTQIKNHGGGHLNHSFFWKLLKKDVVVNQDLNNVIKKEFSSFENFKKLFIDESLKLFGSGWSFLVINKHKLEIVTLSNQDSPLTLGKIPILGIDLWEHAYYLKYQNKRADYLEAIFNVINWNNVYNNYSASH
jgi:Fe-Mn family superoxide dismutase